MPADGYLFSIAGLSASLAGLAGLVAGLRRGSDLRALDAFRLRQIVEFAFANVILALVAAPIAELLGDDALALRILGLVGAIYVAATFALLRVRSLRTNVIWTRGWRLAAVLLGAIAVLLGLAVAVAPSGALFELLLVALLARPMLAFLLVLQELMAAAAA